MNTINYEEKQEIDEYIKQLTETEKKVYEIALNHLGTSFNIKRSNGFKDWKSVATHKRSDT
jgi:hypothetical protein